MERHAGNDELSFKHIGINNKSGLGFKPIGIIKKRELSFKHILVIFRVAPVIISSIFTEDLQWIQYG